MIEGEPENARAHNNLGSVLHLRGDLDSAIRNYNAALDRDPNLVDAVRNLGIAWLAKGDLAEAEKYCRRACALDPLSEELKEQLANVLYEMGLASEKGGRIEEALAHYRNAVEADPKLTAAWLNRGSLLNLSGQPDAAMEHHRRAISLQPDLALGHFNLGLLLLKSGDFSAGWPEYEWRWRLAEFSEQRIPGRHWGGEPVTGKTVLLYAEQGFGDAIQFVRYAPLVAQRGARIIVRCPTRLKQLLGTVPGVSSVISDEERTPEFDFCCPLMSLPGIFGTQLDTIPASMPYVHPGPKELRLWEEKLAPYKAALKIGLAWASHSRSELLSKRKSIALQSLAPFGRAAEAVFFSLQKGPAAEEGRVPPQGMRFIDMSSDLVGFSDSAAMLAHLDLVITMDTAVCHLAGAMGKPVWIMVNFPEDWRWLYSRADSPWYPSARLFRQRKMYEWADVIDQVAQALAAR